MFKIVVVLLFPFVMFASIKVAVTYPYIGALTKSIGAEHVSVDILAKGNWDPHFVVPRPSLITKVRNADALIMNGGGLEIGWLPPLLNRASNPKALVNASSFLNLSHHILLIHKQANASRSGGDIHPEGNPHFHLDPNNILLLAGTVKDFLISLDNANKNDYEKNYEIFASVWKKKLVIWQGKMKNKAGMKVIQFHNTLAYFNKAYGLNSIATIEPLPGISPSSRHTLSLIKLVKDKEVCCILHDVYHSTKTAKYISQKTGIKVILMPHDIGALDEVQDLISLFDYLSDAVQ